MIEQASYEDGIMISRVKYEYDEDGRKIKYYSVIRSNTLHVYKYDYYDNMTMDATYSYYNGKMQYKDSDLYEYDKVGNLIRMSMFEEDILYGTEEYAYDGSGNLIKEESYDAEGNAFWFIGYDYDESGNMIEETTLSYIKKYEYDEQNNKTKEIYYLIDGSIDHYIEWTYEWQ